MGQEHRHLMNEADVGSGEKSPSQDQVEQEQRALGEQIEQRDAGDAGASPASEETLQDGNHLARIATSAQEDGTYEAQVYVRLTREPDIAETYIPVGIFPTEEEARKAAEERARRALEDQEF
jgi:hypothetical protein